VVDDAVCYDGVDGGERHGIALLDSERAVQPFSSEAVTLMQVDESTMVG
jgi:hypothetical protein